MEISFQYVKWLRIVEIFHAHCASKHSFLLFICCDKSDNCKRIPLKSSTSGRIVDHHLFCSPSSAHGWLKIACVWIKCDLFIGSEERERITVQTKSGWNGLKSSYQNHLTREKKTTRHTPHTLLNSNEKEGHLKKTVIYIIKSGWWDIPDSLGEFLMSLSLSLFVLS